VNRCLAAGPSQRPPWDARDIARLLRIVQERVYIFDLSTVAASHEARRPLAARPPRVMMLIGLASQATTNEQAREQRQKKVYGDDKRMFGRNCASFTQENKRTIHRFVRKTRRARSLCHPGVLNGRSLRTWIGSKFSRNIPQRFSVRSKPPSPRGEASRNP